VFINVYPLLRCLAVKNVEEIVEVQLRVTDLQPNQSKLCTGHHLGLYKVMDTLHILELIHKLSKIRRLRVPRKQSVIHHGQSAAEEISELLNLSGSILELNNSAGTILVRPKINIIISGEFKENLDSRVHTLFFSDCVKERTYTQHRRSNTA
jgi:hypothetical protein